MGRGATTAIRPSFPCPTAIPRTRRTTFARGPSTRPTASRMRKTSATTSGIRMAASRRTSTRSTPVDVAAVLASGDRVLRPVLRRETVSAAGAARCDVAQPHRNAGCEHPFVGGCKCESPQARESRDHDPGITNRGSDSIGALPGSRSWLCTAGEDMGRQRALNSRRAFSLWIDGHGTHAAAGLPGIA